MEQCLGGQFKSDKVERRPQAPSAQGPQVGCTAETGWWHWGAEGRGGSFRVLTSESELDSETVRHVEAF